MPTEEPPGCLMPFLKLLRLWPPTAGPSDSALPYEVRPAILTPAERSFFGVLKTCIPDGTELFAMVRLADLLVVKKGTEKRQSFFNRIQSKHIDFVLCDSATLAPRLAIELDDSSHNRKDRSSRDSFVDRALKAAQLPLLRVPARKGYNPEEIRAAIVDAIGSME